MVVYNSVVFIHMCTVFVYICMRQCMGVIFVNTCVDSQIHLYNFNCLYRYMFVCVFYCVRLLNIIHEFTHPELQP